MLNNDHHPDVGDKKTVYSSSLLIEQEDALSLKDNEEVSSKKKVTRLSQTTP